MKIKSLYFRNGFLGWEVQRIEFQNLNLLVGLSGAGKSQIINALWLLRGVAVSGNFMNNVDWNLEFSIGEKQFVWKGSFGATGFDAKYKVKAESIQSSTGEKIERKGRYVWVNSDWFNDFLDIKLNDFKGAVEDFSASIHLNDENAKGYFGRGFAKWKLKDFPVFLFS